MLLLFQSELLNMVFFFFNDTATTEIYTLSYTLSLHDALPISHHLALATHSTVHRGTGVRPGNRETLGEARGDVGRAEPDEFPIGVHLVVISLRKALRRKNPAGETHQCQTGYIPHNGWIIFKRE